MDRKINEKVKKKLFTAAYRLFAEKGYGKANMRELSDEAGVSKSLIFFYFRNKADLYMALWNHAAELTEEYLKSNDCDSPDISFFDTLERGLHAKAEIMRKYPDIYRFILRAYYETDGDVRERIHDSYRAEVMKSGRNFSAQLHTEAFREGTDLKMMYKTILLASEGFVYQSVMDDRCDADT
ncbi:MAG: TetR/AcrR family transcriptional regulator, partial [Bullifex sp.]